MKEHTGGRNLVGAMSLAAAMAAGGVQAEEGLPVRAVALFTSGVGYYQHAGAVNGGAPLRLSFKSDQINDVLKSLILEDLSGGQPGAVVYPSRDPLEKTLGGFQVDLTGVPDLAGLINQLRGAAVTVHHQGSQVAGTVLGCEQRPVAVDAKGQPVKDWLLNLASEGALLTIPFNAITRLQLSDPQLRRELEQALATIDQDRGKERKTVTITFPGEGNRQVRVGYVVESPVWKSSYRLVMPDAPGEKGLIQGWAIVENQTDNDWQGVRLSLVSGQPVSFQQDLYKPLYVQRPTVAVERGPVVTPQAHEAGVREKRRRKSAEGAMAMEAAPLAMAPRALMDADAGAFGGGGATNWEEAPVDPTGIAARAGGERVGALFRYTVAGVDLPRRRSTMLPIVATPLPVEAVSLYNAEQHAAHPLNAVLLHNDTGNHLPAGPVTVFAGQVYGGDALLGELPDGQQRLLSYAVDLDVTMDPAFETRDQTITSGKIVQGVLTLTTKERTVREYAADNRGGRDKVLIIEHPRRHGWSLVEGTAPFETTDSHHRFRFSLAAGENARFQVVEERIRDQRVVLLHTPHSQLLHMVSEGAISPPVRKALEEAARLQRNLEDVQRQLQENGAAQRDLEREQQRLRENLKAAPRGSQFHNRLLAKLDQEETRMEQLRQEEERLTGAVQERRRQLEAYLAGLSVE